MLLSETLKHPGAVTGRALDRVTKQKHRPNRPKIVQTNVRKLCVSAPADNFGHFWDISSTFFRHFVGIPFKFCWAVQHLPVIKRPGGYLCKSLLSYLFSKTPTGPPTHRAPNDLCLGCSLKRNFETTMTICLASSS